MSLFTGKTLMITVPPVIINVFPVNSDIFLLLLS